MIPSIGFLTIKAQLYENLKEKAHLGFVECQFETRLKQIEHLLEGAEYVQI